MTLINSKGTESTSIFGGLTLNNKSKANVTLTADVKFAEASKRTKAINITGNKLNNTIFGSSGSDKLYGLAGNDSLLGNAGNDVLIYKTGDGNDTIFDYDNGDMLKILKADGSEGGTFSSSSSKSSKLTLAIDSGSTVPFDGVSKSDTFNINGTSYKISGKKLAIN